VPDRRLARFAAFTLAFNVGVVLFGAVVRATGSGAGCGSHWPTCGGDVVPLSGSVERFVEFGHRASSGIALLLVGTLAVWVVRTRDRGDPVRRAGIAAGILIVNEALIGAALVLFEWVADDRSAGRAVSITIHLLNTFLLLAALSLTAWWASGRPIPRGPVEERGTVRRLAVAAAALMVVGAAGAVTALGDTLFPPDEYGGGFSADPTGGLLVRLRWVHPILAVVTAGYLLHLARRLPAPEAMRSALASLVVVQLAAGVVNVGLSAPVWMQVVHLFLADAVWVGFVLTSSESLAARSPVAA